MYSKDGKTIESKMSDCADNMLVYMNLTDDVIQRILESPDENNQLKEVAIAIYTKVQICTTII